jgi:hypothetical protein
MPLLLSHQQVCAVSCSSKLRRGLLRVAMLGSTFGPKTSPLIRSSPTAVGLPSVTGQDSGVRKCSTEMGTGTND